MPSIKPPIWSLLILPLFIPFTATAQDCELDRQAIRDFFYSLEPTLLETDETPGPYYLKEGETCYYGMAREVYSWQRAAQLCLELKLVSRSYQRAEETLERAALAEALIPPEENARRGSVYYYVGRLYEDVYFDIESAASYYRLALHERPDDDEYLFRVRTMHNRLRLRGLLDPYYEWQVYLDFFKTWTREVPYQYLWSDWCGWVEQDPYDPNWVYSLSHGWWRLQQLEPFGPGGGGWVYSTQLKWTWLFRGTRLWVYLAEMPEGYRYVFLTEGDFPERWFYLPEQDQWGRLANNESDPDLDQDGQSDWWELEQYGNLDK